jgi:hypothetical protein
MAGKKRCNEKHEARESIGDEHWEHNSVITPSAPDSRVKAFVFQRDECGGRR